MTTALAILCVCSLGAGVLMRLVANRQRTELGREIHWYHVRYWFRPDLNDLILTTRGRRFHAWSQMFLMIGLALYAIAFGIGPLV